MFFFNASVYSNSLYETKEVNIFIENMYTKHNYNKEKLKKLFANIKEEKKLPKFFKSAPERKLTWNGCDIGEEKCINYKKLFVNKSNIQNGSKFIRQNYKSLENATIAYGVPSEIITAIIGIETRYGKNLGKFNTFNTLASLSLGPNKGRRAKFYKTELENFLLLCRENNFNPATVQGSYAGALGKPQFISSSYRNYAIDFDGDNYADLWNSNADVIGSVANYLKKNGWNKGGMILTDLTTDNNEKVLDRFSKMTYKPHTLYKDYQSKNITASRPIAVDEKLSVIKRIEGKNTVYSFGHNNFYTITRYNRSRLYALAVFTLAQEIKLASQ
tara:strand:+ start:23 stop:1012 length:990 start_codon:yes stop_codon:yes gene_type:complete